MSWEIYLLYLAVVAVFFASPPDTSQLLVISNSARHGLRRSSFTIAGDLSANAIQMTLAAFGLAAVIATSATAFLWIKWLGVAYLAWIGIRLILSRQASQTNARATSSVSAFRLYRQGFIASMANPFAIVFFAALFPQFIDPHSPILLQLIVLGGTYLVVDGVILVVWGWLGMKAAHVLKQRSMALVNRICGLLMIGAAALLASRDFEGQQPRRH
jgi:homoserine/homoserine lactone efflux protein